MLNVLLLLLPPVWGASLEPSLHHLDRRFNGQEAIRWTPLPLWGQQEAGLSEEQKKKWLEALADDDIEVRDTAQQEILKAYDPAVEAWLKEILANEKDAEITSRMRSILRRNSKEQALEKRLSENFRKYAPDIAYWIYSEKEEDIPKIIRSFEFLNNKTGKLEKYASKEDIEIIYPLVLEKMKKVNPDWTQLQEETKEAFLWDTQGRGRVLKGKIAKDYEPQLRSLLKDK